MRIWKVLLLGVLCIKMAGCGFEAAPTSALELDNRDSSQVIYGDDSIRDVTGEAPNSEASVALVKKSLYDQYKKNRAIYSVGEVYGVEDLSWSDQPALAFCSGIFLGDDLVLTAGHCVENDFSCANTNIVFHFSADSQVTTAIACKEVVKYRNDINGAGLDYALIRMEKNIGRRSFVLNSSAFKRPQVADSLYSLGYPLGSFMKKALGKIRKIVPESQVYVSTLDVFEGNSGSPVFSAKTHQLVGILSSGESDFTQKSDDDSAVQVKRCSNKGCSGEFITPIEKILADIGKKRSE
ncbi:trypsin-like serine peptidase [Bdellovibrio sp. BCCA]|uniref:trypsin-like serine peptidase n=1 Tax=Bdellovibrio sp. BCCA TaxID=3136281 RepID=UPI0030F26542